MKVRTVERRRDLLYDHENGRVEVISNSLIAQPRRYGIVIPIDKNQHLSKQFETEFRHWDYMPEEGEAIVELPTTRGSIRELKKLIDEFITENKVAL